MGIIPRFLFVLALIVAPIVVWSTTSTLPVRVATHFGSGGMANGWMSRDGYALFMIVMITVLPLTIVSFTGFIPRFAVSQIARRKRDFWLSPQLRDETLAWLASHACSMGVLIIAFLSGIHFLTIEANRRSPPRLDESSMFAVVIGFVVLLVIWIGALALRFLRTR